LRFAAALLDQPETMRAFQVGMKAKVKERLDALYGTELDPATRQRLHTAQQQLDATIEALTGLPEALDPNYRSHGR